MTRFRLYLVTDRRIVKGGLPLGDAVGAALHAGVRAVQLREKDLPVRALLPLAYSLRELTARSSALLFVNDRLDVALAVGADGVHLGTRSMPASAARKAGGGRMMIGVSAHSVQEARRAEEEGADFVTLGPVYDTPSKRVYGQPVGLAVLREVTRACSIPVYAIGGISPRRVAEVTEAGAAGVAVLSGILGAPDIEASTKEYMRVLQ